MLNAAVQVNTRVAHNTLTPVWDEQLHVLVQEPSTQMLRIEMFDHDLINVKVQPCRHTTRNDCASLKGAGGVHAHVIRLILPCELHPSFCPCSPTRFLCQC